MFRLTREVRICINPGDDACAPEVTNSFAGGPALTGLGRYFSLRVMLAGELNSASQYLRNIKDVDAVVRRQAVPLLAKPCASAGTNPNVHALLVRLFETLQHSWPGATLAELSLGLSPFLTVGAVAGELPMTRLSQKFEFSAAHRLHNPELSDAENQRLFGKCNNPLGHGHNYEVQVTLKTSENALANLPEIERTVNRVVIERFDHKHLNLETEEFRQSIPTVENIARVIYRLLKPHFAAETKLAGVTVWETPKTWCDYDED